MVAKSKIVGSAGVLLPLILFHLFSSSETLLASSNPPEGAPDDVVKLLRRASDSIKLKQYGEALELLNAAIESDADLSEAYWKRASVLRQLCRYEESEKNYKRFLELKPGTPAVEKELSQLLQAQNGLETAYSLFDLGEFSKALDYIVKVVLVFSPSCIQAKLFKVKLLLALKDYSGAVSETDFILKEDESNLEALLLRGRAYYG